MPHHWKPGDKDQAGEEMKEPEYRGTAANGEVWELWGGIDEDEAREIEERPDKHPCERILRP